MTRDLQSFLRFKLTLSFLNANMNRVLSPMCMCVSGLPMSGL